MTDLPLTPPQSLNTPLGRMFRDEPVFAGAALIVALTAVPSLVAMGLDPRQFQGDSVWLKPLKFQIALAIYLATLAFFARWLPRGMTDRRGYRVYAGIVVFTVFGEIAWIGGAAAFGTASHFNVGTPLMATIYGLMGVFAITLTSATLVYGVAIWRNRTAPLDPTLRAAIGLGLILTFGLTMIVANLLAAQSGHLVGTPETGARLPVLGWSREVGDLRVAHFFATHALHVVPLLALAVPARPVWVWSIGAGYAAFTLAVFVQALAGQPLI